MVRRVTNLLNFESGFPSGVNSLFSIDLGIRGSEMFAEMDLRALKPYQILIKEVGLRHCVDPALIAAIISRESHGGAVLQDGWDHRGLRFGLMQVPGKEIFSQSHFILPYGSSIQTGYSFAVLPVFKTPWYFSIICTSLFL